VFCSGSFPRSKGVKGAPFCHLAELRVCRRTVQSVVQLMRYRPKSIAVPQTPCPCEYQVLISVLLDISWYRQFGAITLLFPLPVSFRARRHFSWSIFVFVSLSMMAGCQRRRDGCDGEKPISNSTSFNPPLLPRLS
jgi:hypothetical protein